MNVLIVHQNFPGQFPHVADALLARGDRVAAIGGATAKGRPGIDLRRWSLKRGTTPGILTAAIRAEADLMRAEAAAAAALTLKRDGFVPDVIIGHPGWGETIHLKEIWPETRLILLGEYWYLTHGGDSNFDPEFATPDLADDLRVNAKNATQALSYAFADAIVCPTPWQASTFPAAFQPRIRVIHEGIDLSRAKRRPDARVRLPDGRWLDGSKPVVTFVNRTIEPLRGAHIFLRALPAFLNAVPEAEVLVIGREAASGYGGAAPGGKTWKAHLLDELGDPIDLRRVHFLGPVEHKVLIDAFSISWAHVYYSYPFVLSWSLIEAMACECLVIAGDTPPVRDAITDGENGVLLPFFDVDALRAALTRACALSERYSGLRCAARVAAINAFEKAGGVGSWLRWLDEVRLPKLPRP